ncbi:formate dehydrogenase accessory protein FdhE [Pseudomonas oryzihabitans]|uniref:formate dehydrogenase accessory protein FdhE n=1 Tax=Pseudomonas oryzihabitans TaxID=47885 RepID=UPI0011A68706|nr:formate dehydrogenase accessory protein FdhE [Pseudomonas psychrotolerans]
MAGQILEPGEIEAAAVNPDFILLPGGELFGYRADRLRLLAAGNALGDYLLLMAELCEAQQRVFDSLAPLPLDEARSAQSLQHGLPPLSYDTLVREGDWLPALDALLAALQIAQSPVQAALDALRHADAGQRKAWAIALLAGSYELVPAAVVPFLGAALQLAWTHWLQRSDFSALREQGSQTTCPCCGAPAMAGVIHHLGKANGLRYLTCSLCACEWHFVRVKCSHCETGKGLGYYSLGTDDANAQKAPLRAETCAHCKTYLKHLYRDHDARSEPLSADLASLALDVRLAEEGYERHAPNLLFAPG